AAARGHISRGLRRGTRIRDQQRVEVERGADVGLGIAADRPQRVNAGRHGNRPGQPGAGLDRMVVLQRHADLVIAEAEQVAVLQFVRALAPQGLLTVVDVDAVGTDVLEEIGALTEAYAGVVR